MVSNSRGKKWLAGFTLRKHAEKVTLKQPEYINCDQTIKVSFKERTNGLQGRQEESRYETGYHKGCQLPSPRDCRRRRGSNLPRSGLPGGKGVSQAVLGDSRSMRSPEVILLKLLRSWKKGSLRNTR